MDSSEKKDKSNLKKLLAAKKKKKGTQNTTSAPKEDEEAVPKAVDASQDDTNDAASPEPKLQQKAKEDDDESDDETNYTAKTTTKIVEHQADSSQKKDVIEMPDYMIPKDQKEETADAKKPRRNANDIQFGGGRPQFGNRKNVKGILGGDDFQSLDALDNDGKQSQPQKNKRTNADGAGYAFENLGSTPVQKTKKFEEEKEKEKPKGPPKFFSSSKGNKNVGGNKNTETTGQNTMYDFGVKYKSDFPDKKPQEKNEDGMQVTETRKDKRRINHDKTRFDENKPAQSGLIDAQDIDDGFQIVRNPAQQRRTNQQRQFNRNKDLDSEKRDGEGPSVIKRGGVFGNIGGDSD